jgi:hypothetical protein
MEDHGSVESRILLIRGKKVLLGIHLAELYAVEPRVLIQAVNRNIKRFPEDFMFQLTWDEVAALKSHPSLSVCIYYNPGSLHFVFFLK